MELRNRRPLISNSMDTDNVEEMEQTNGNRTRLLSKRKERETEQESEEEGQPPAKH